MQLTVRQTENQYIVSRSDAPFPVQDNLFDADFVQGTGHARAADTGRGGTWFFSWQQQPLVLRHYRRGGWLTGVLYDRYFWTGLENTRAWREMKLLAKLCAVGLPVPIPLAARVKHAGIWYTADLVTEEIQSAEALSYCLCHQALSAEIWARLGQVLRRFHAYGVFHADLNAHNILLKDDEIYLIDFDKGKIWRGNSVKWQLDNLQRLQRSLLKLKKQRARFYFEQHHWQQLLSGYHTS